MKLPQDVSGSFSSHTQVVRAVRSPLGFFVLALLIIEAFLTLGGTLFGLPLPYKVALLFVGVFLFMLVLGAVYRLVVHHPRNLVFSEGSHVAYSALRFYGIETKPMTRADMEDRPAIEPPKSPAGQLTEKSSEFEK